MVTEAGERLGKRHGLPGIGALRDRGVKLETLYGWVWSAPTGQNMNHFATRFPSPTPLTSMASIASRGARGLAMNDSWEIRLGTPFLE